jgi:hypothetical protein
LLLVDDDFLELGLAVVADVFVYWHWYSPRNGVLNDYSRIGGLSVRRESEESFAAPRRLFHFGCPNTQILENAMENARRLSFPAD